MPAKEPRSRVRGMADLSIAFKESKKNQTRDVTRAATFRHAPPQTKGPSALALPT